MRYAPVMELADMQDLGSCVERRVGSNPFRRSHILFIISLLVFKKNMIDTIIDTTSAIGNANHTLLTTPVFERTYAAGSNTTICLAIDTIIL